MARLISPLGPPDRAGRDDTPLATTLEAELTRVATRVDVAAPSSPLVATSSSAVSATGTAPVVASPGAAVPARVEAATHSEARPGFLPRPPLGWAGVLTLLNVVLSGFILVLWGVPRAVPSASSATSAPAAPTAASVPGTPGAARSSTDVTLAAPSASVEPATSAAAADAPAKGESAAKGTPSPAARNPAAGPTAETGLNGSAPPVGSRTADSRGADSRTARTTASGSPSASTSLNPSPLSTVSLKRVPPEGAVATIPSLPSGPLATVPGQRLNDAPAPPGSAVVNAGEDGVTMPERLPESHVRPTVAALPTGEPVTGEVRLRATVRVDGSVQDVEVVSTTRPGVGLEQAALDAVRRWRYKPATRDGQPVDARLAITLTFR